MGVLADARDRWHKGRPEYRELGQPFVGDPILEGYEEQLDSINYLAVAHDLRLLGGARYLLCTALVLVVACLLRPLVTPQHRPGLLERFRLH